MKSLSTDYITQVILLAIAIMVFGPLNYIAWFVPSMHRNILRTYGRFYRHWPFDAEAYWNSSFHFWLTRIVYLLGFLFVLVQLALKIVELLAM